jgi:hypothetical protein
MTRILTGYFLASPKNTGVLLASRIASYILGFFFIMYTAWIHRGIRDRRDAFAYAMMRRRE